MRNLAPLTKYLGYFYLKTLLNLWCRLSSEGLKILLSFLLALYRATERNYPKQAYLDDLDRSSVIEAEKTDETRKCCLYRSGSHETKTPNICRFTSQFNDKFETIEKARFKTLLA